jgi:hypothetical protein
MKRYLTEGVEGLTERDALIFGRFLGYTGFDEHLLHGVQAFLN